MTETKTTAADQESPGQKAVALVLMIFAVWFILMAVGLLIGTLYDGGGYTIGNYVPLLAVSLILVFGIVPFFPLLRSLTYMEYLKESGIHIPLGMSKLVVLGLFLMCSILGFWFDIRGGMQAIMQYHHNRSLFMILLSSIQPAISEELVIRGVMYGAIRRFRGHLAAIVGTAIVFGFIHLAQGPARFLTGFIVGLAWGVLRCQTGTIWPGSAMHFMINFGAPTPAWISWLVTMGASLLIRPFERRTRPGPVR